eukprot:5682707-Alexandrium_andersonii.AAC.1
MPTAMHHPARQWHLRPPRPPRPSKRRKAGPKEPCPERARSGPACDALLDHDPRGGHSPRLHQPPQLRPNA